MNPVIDAPTRLPPIPPEKIWLMLAGIAVYLPFELWMKIDAAGQLSKVLRDRRRSRESEIRPPAPDEALFQRAESLFGTLGCEKSVHCEYSAALRCG
jgi:hypothetical protein